MKICRIIPDQQNNWPKHHVACYLATNGADGYWADFTAVGGPAKAPNLILTVAGRRSGKSYTLGLIYGDIDGCYVIIGSRGGAHEHPAWYLNLLANPSVEVQIKERKFHATFPRKSVKPGRGRFPPACRRGGLAPPGPRGSEINTPAPK